MTREHVLRAAFVKLLPGCTGTVLDQLTFDRNTAEPTHKKKRIPQSSYNFTVNDVCKICNEGWLNVKVEIAAEKFLFPLILGNEIELPKQATDILALWAAKTAVVRSLIDAKPFAVPPEHFSWIKENLTPPPSTFVWLGRAEFTPYSWTRQRKFILQHDENFARAHMTTIVIGHVAFYILGCGNNFWEEDFMSTISYLNGHPIFQIWPSTNATHFNKLPAFGRAKIKDLSSTRLNSLGMPSTETLQAIKD
ncbi:hypothetical protein CLU94_3331 [Janthinobacterium sp. 13]|nr:hypothetical protein CLU94_3331 [Janthinobacterium sp. 13]